MISMSGLSRGTREIYCQIRISMQCTVLESSRSMTHNALLPRTDIRAVWVEACKHPLQECYRFYARLDLDVAETDTR